MATEHIRHRNSHPVRVFLLLTQPTVLACVIILMLLQWRVPTLVYLELTLPWRETFFDEIAAQTRLASGEFFPADVRQIVIRYPEYPEMTPKREPLPGTLFLHPVDAMFVEKFSSDFLQQEIQISLVGQVTQLSLRHDRQNLDYRLTMFDRLKHSSRALGAGIIIWLVLTVMGWVNLYRELKRFA